MGYVFDFNDAVRYEQWLEDPKNGFVADMQNRLLVEMLKPKRGDTLIEIGCGTGKSLAALADDGIGMTGLDPSPYMIDIARKNLGISVDLHRGFAEDLPFGDNSFNHAVFMTSLEYVQDPAKALEEACRVAKDRLFIGVLNRYALKSVQHRVEGVFSQTLYNRARFFSVWEIGRMLRAILGDVPIAWRTVCHLTDKPGRVLNHFERSWIVQRCPFGAFAGIQVILVPRYRTRPLSLKYTAKQTAKPVAG